MTERRRSFGPARRADTETPEPEPRQIPPLNTPEQATDEDKARGRLAVAQILREKFGRTA